MMTDEHPISDSSEPADQPRPESESAPASSDVETQDDDADDMTDAVTVAPNAAERREKGLQRAALVARIADDHRGQNTVVLDLTEITSLFDYFVITSGTSRRQMHAVAEEVDRVQEDMGADRLGLEGYRESVWIVQDYGDIVLHVLTPEAREAYDLEGLWADAKRVDWETLAPPKRRPM